MTVDRARILFEKWKVCVLVPTYNNAATLGPLLREINAYTSNVLVVNDGSTDHTLDMLKEFPSVEVLSFPMNQGKGMALRKGFNKARSMGFDYAISIDSDGQHYPADLIIFLDQLDQGGPALMVGQRNMEQSNVPKKSSFGNRFSNFWFAVETGIRLSDTQSGYRLYPLQQLKDVHFFTRKYEFEIEVMVRAAWKGIPVIGVPVSVYYPPPGERVSHFRPFRDFTRISILNTVLFFGAILFYWPGKLLKKIFPERWLSSIRKNLVNPDETNSTKVFSVAFGLFMGIVPIWGFQLIVAILLSFLFKLNKGLVVLAANISVPPMIPLILFLSVRLGAIWMPGQTTEFDFSRSLTMEDLSAHMQQYLYGSITLATVVALAGALLTTVFINLAGRKSSTAT